MKTGARYAPQRMAHISLYSSFKVKNYFNILLKLKSFCDFKIILKIEDFFEFEVSRANEANDLMGFHGDLRQNLRPETTF